jgi:hypothetical protein
LAAKLTKTSNDANNSELIVNTHFKATLKKALEAYSAEKHYPESMSELFQCFLTADYMIMDHLNNNDEDLVIKPTDPFYPILERCYSMVILGEYENHEASKLSISPALDIIRTSFAAKIKDPVKEKKKYIQFSGHDSTLAPYMILTGIANSECILKDLLAGTRTKSCVGYPPVASNMVWELIKDIDGKKGQFGVKFSYNGNYIDFCKNKKIDKGGQYYCTIEEFNTALEKYYMYKDYAQTCGW